VRSGVFRAFFELPTDFFCGFLLDPMSSSDDCLRFDLRVRGLSSASLGTSVRLLEI